jgi:hypothetical protein
LDNVAKFIDTQNTREYKGLTDTAILVKVLQYNASQAALGNDILTDDDIKEVITRLKSM